MYIIFINIHYSLQCQTKFSKVEAKAAHGSDKDLLLNHAELTFHELHMEKLTTFDFLKQLTDMHEMLHHDDNCEPTEFCYSNCRHRFVTGDDDPWV